jgi:hypothetical protein
VGVSVGASVAAEVAVNVAAEVEVKTAVAVGFGADCSVSAIAAETVPATIVAIRPVSTVGAGCGVDAVESPGTAQATLIAKNIRAMKIVRLLFMYLPRC